MRSLYTAATGMQAQQMRIDAVANNLANVTTTGFKRSRADFQDLFYDTIRASGARSANDAIVPGGIQVGHGTKLSEVSKVYTQGERTNTGRDLDLAIAGDGFFQIQKPGGETMYTRDGTFRLDQNGTIVTGAGFELQPAITVPTDAVQITVLEDGTVSVLAGDDVEPTDVGQIELVRFVNPAGLRAMGGNLLVFTEASGNPEAGSPDQLGFGAISQGMLESSNVNIAEELVKMILAQRSFEVNSRVMKAGDEMLQAVAALQR